MSALGGELFAFWSSMARANITNLARLRAGGRISQQDLFLAVALDDIAGTLAGWQANIDEVHLAITKERRNIGIEARSEEHTSELQSH